jgi:hypothetical protein
MKKCPLEHGEDSLKTWEKTRSARKERTLHQEDAIIIKLKKAGETVE